MPLQYLQFRPGVSRESTNLANSGGWYACDKIRFRSGMPEKIGGWTAATINTFLGTCKHIVEWDSLTGYYLLGLGTNLKYYIYSGGVFFDATAIRVTVNLPNNPVTPIYSTLSANISAIDTTFNVVSGTSFSNAPPFTIQIDSETIWVSSVATNTLSGCIRGYGGTTAATHTSTTTVSSTYVAIKSTNNNAVSGDFVTFASLSAFGPYTAPVLNAEFQIAQANASYILINTGVQSTSASVGGGNVPATAAYQATTGLDITSFGNGWGAGPWNGNHGWNTGFVGTGVSTELRIWSADNFGQDLFYNAEYGPIYYWTASTELSTTGQVTGRGINICSMAGSDGYAPVIGTRVFVTEERHVVVLGSNDPTIPAVAAGAFVTGSQYMIKFVGSTDFVALGASKNEIGQYFTAGGAGTGTGTAIFAQRDPLLIQWCSQENPLVWNPSDITNTAGFYRVTNGSELVTSEKTRQETLIWTDSAVYSMQFQGPPYVFGFNLISAEITIASPNAATTANGITYWMGKGKFYAYSGRVDTLPCSLRQYIFDDINMDQIGQVFAGTSEKFNEVWWFYPAADSQTTDRYVIYNYLEKLWYYGQMERTSWLDSHIQGLPWATVAGRLLQHENGVDDGLTNPPSAIVNYIESADFDIGDGVQFSFVKRIIPDIDFIGSQVATPSVTMTLSTRNFPGEGTFTSTDIPVAVGSKVSTQVYNYTDQVWLRLRGRQVAFRIGSDAVGVKWQLGTPRLDVQPDGRR
jgi:hypothetical protein